MTPNASGGFEEVHQKDFISNEDKGGDKGGCSHRLALGYWNGLLSDKIPLSNIVKVQVLLWKLYNYMFSANKSYPIVDFTKAWKCRA